MGNDNKIPANQVESWEIDNEIDVVPGSALRPYTEPFESVMSRAIKRRTMLKGTGASVATLVVAPGLLAPSTGGASGYVGSDAKGGRRWGRNPANRLTFDAIAPSTDPDVEVPLNYEWNVILRWGDPLTENAPKFNVHEQTAAAQAQQFGFNADLVLWYPLSKAVRFAVKRRGRLPKIMSQFLGVAYPRIKHKRMERAVMIVNHEYTKARDMFPDYDPENYPTPEQTRIEIEAHGFSIIELYLDRHGKWHFDRTSPFNRRVTGSTVMDITGPLRGYDMMKSHDNPSGTQVRGCLNNCAGGKTPWGTVLTCEENFDQYFANFNTVRVEYPEIAALSERIAAEDEDTDRGWEKHVGRFDLSRDPKEYHLFGYIVEVDPYDPSAKPKKRTAMGRFKHEGAAATISKNGRVVVYSGDDARFEYVYKFVSKGRYRPNNRSANMDLLDEGTLYVARFDTGQMAGDDMGTGGWLELSPDNPALADWSLEEILLNTRGAADVVGATPMDRPEDIEVSPETGQVYIACTNNSRRDGNPGDTREVNGRMVSSSPDESNPRNNTYNNPTKNTGNQHGHVVELVEQGNDAGSLTFRWNIFIKCGDPSVPAHDTSFGDVADPVAAGVSPISDPDNLVHDDHGNLWIATDGMPFSDEDDDGFSIGFGQNDGVFAVPTEGPDRGLLKQFLSGVPGGEVCGPEFSGDNRSFFCAIQHPNDGNAFEHIWPLDESDAKTPVSKPSLIGVRELSGRKIGK